MHKTLTWLFIFIVGGCSHQADLQNSSHDSASMGADQTQVTDSNKDVDVQSASAQTICKREKVIGSHRVTRVCRTAGEVRAEQEAARRTLRESAQEYEQSSVKTDEN